MTRHRWLSGTVLVVLVATVSPADTPGGQGVARYWCHDYTIGLLTGERRVGTSGATLEQALREAKYRMESFPDIRSLAAAGARPGDIVMIGNMRAEGFVAMHSGVFATADTINHFFGETYTGASEMSWTINDLAGFARTRTPAGVEIPPIRSFAGRVVQVWRYPGYRPARIPALVGPPRCKSIHEKDPKNPTCLLQCNRALGHARSERHRDWAGHSWINLGTQEVPGLDGAWTYMGGRGRALVQQQGQAVTLELTWVPAGEPPPTYRIQATLQGASLDGHWQCLVPSCGHESGRFHADVDPSGRTITVSRTEDPTGRRNWNSVVLGR